MAVDLFISKCWCKIPYARLYGMLAASAISQLYFAIIRQDFKDFSNSLNLTASVSNMALSRRVNDRTDVDILLV